MSITCTTYQRSNNVACQPAAVASINATIAHHNYQITVGAAIECQSYTDDEFHEQSKKNQ